MPLTGLVAEARKRTAMIDARAEQIQQNPSQLKHEVKRVIDFSSELEQAAKTAQPVWQDCKHLKQSGERKFCKRYFSLCAEEKCNGKYINSDEKELDIKRILRGK